MINTDIKIKKEPLIHCIIIFIIALLTSFYFTNKVNAVNVIDNNTFGYNIVIEDTEEEITDNLFYLNPSNTSLNTGSQLYDRMNRYGLKIGYTYTLCNYNNDTQNILFQLRLQTYNENNISSTNFKNKCINLTIQDMIRYDVMIINNTGSSKNYTPYVSLYEGNVDRPSNYEINNRNYITHSINYKITNKTGTSGVKNFCHKVTNINDSIARTCVYRTFSINNNAEYGISTADYIVDININNNNISNTYVSNFYVLDNINPNQIQVNSGTEYIVYHFNNDYKIKSALYNNIYISGLTYERLYFESWDMSVVNNNNNLCNKNSVNISNYIVSNAITFESSCTYNNNLYDIAKLDYLDNIVVSASVNSGQSNFDSYQHKFNIGILKYNIKGNESSVPGYTGDPNNQYENYVECSSWYDLPCQFGNGVTYIIYNVPILGPVIGFIVDLVSLMYNLVTALKWYENLGILFSIFILIMFLKILSILWKGKDE